VGEGAHRLRVSETPLSFWAAPLSIGTSPLSIGTTPRFRGNVFRWPVTWLGLCLTPKFFGTHVSKHYARNSSFDKPFGRLLSKRPAQQRGRDEVAARRGRADGEAHCRYAKFALYRQSFREDLFFSENFVYLYDELFTPGKMSSQS
jgi:hypothetical protein